jgi:hypothetical protein
MNMGPTPEDIKNFIRDTYAEGDSFTCQDVYTSVLQPGDITLYKVLDQLVRDGYLSGALFYGPEEDSPADHTAAVYLVTPHPVQGESLEFSENGMPLGWDVEVPE